MPTVESDLERPEHYRALVLGMPDGVLRLHARSWITIEWISGALESVEAGEGRRHGRAALPSGGGAFVKVYHPRAKHSLWRRLRSSRAIAEGAGYIAFGEAGIETPELLAWGEVRRRGVWMRGVVITRLIEGPTVAEDFAGRGDAGVLERAAECLARVHRAGLAHGDPRLRNFLVRGAEVLPFDLCSWGRLSAARRRGDLVKFLGSARTVVERGVAQGLLAKYGEAAAWRAADGAGLMSDAAAYAQRERVP